MVAAMSMNVGAKKIENDKYGAGHYCVVLAMIWTSLSTRMNVVVVNWKHDSQALAWWRHWKFNNMLNSLYSLIAWNFSNSLQFFWWNHVCLHIAYSRHLRWSLWNLCHEYDFNLSDRCLSCMVATCVLDFNNYMLNIYSIILFLSCNSIVSLDVDWLYFHVNFLLMYWQTLCQYM